MDNSFKIAEDCLLIREMMSLSQSELAERIDTGIATVNRWENGQTEPSDINLQKFYSFAYQNGFRLNKIKEQFYREELSPGELLLFHGAKDSINGPIRYNASRGSNDFGTGFYMGESFRQAALFVSNFESSCVYFLSMETKGLKSVTYKVDTKWMMTIAYFRGKLKGRIGKKTEDAICSKVNDADYIIAPIADNRMYQIIDNFIDGEITDEQCRHALAATDLGLQYVLKSGKAADSVKMLERSFLCSDEKRDYSRARSNDLRSAEDKVRAARIKYRGKGKYIDELL